MEEPLFSVCVTVISRRVSSPTIKKDVSRGARSVLAAAVTMMFLSPYPFMGFMVIHVSDISIVQRKLEDMTNSRASPTDVKSIFVYGVTRTSSLRECIQPLSINANAGKAIRLNVRNIRFFIM